MKNRAYSLLTVKSVSEDRRIIRGMATTPAPDRHGDIVEPLGATFAASVPLLWHHRSDQPVGWVKFGAPTAEGIPFEAEIAQIAEPGVLKDRTDEAWQSVTSGLVAGVSLGFRPLEYAILDDGGLRFTRYEIFELSLVTIPANAEATVALVKSLDAKRPPLSGQPAPASDNPAPVEGKKSQKGNEMTLAEQIAAREAKRKALVAKMNGAVQKSLDDGGRSMSDDETATFDEAKAEIEALDKDLDRLKSLEAFQAGRATLAVGGNPDQGGQSRSGVVPAQAKGAEPAPGIRLARYARCLALARKGHRDLAAVADEQYGYRDPAVGIMVKAAVAASNTTTDAALIGNVGGFADFVEFLRPQTIVGKFGQGGIPALTAIPFYIPVILETSAGEGFWVGEGAAVPLTKASWARQTLTPKKVGALAAATMDQLRDSSPAAEMLIRNDLSRAVIRRMDMTFIDPLQAITDTRPGSVLNGVPPLVSAGPGLAGVKADLGTLMGAFVNSGNPLSTGVWIMSASRALRLSLVDNQMGNRAFPLMSMAGGTLEGLPVIVSEYAGDVVALVNAADIYIADDGGVEVDISTDASLEMRDDPVGNSKTPIPATEMVSLWQTDSVGFRAIRTVNWMRRRASGVAWMNAVTWGDPVAPGGE